MNRMNPMNRTLLASIMLLSLGGLVPRPVKKKHVFVVGLVFSDAGYKCEFCDARISLENFDKMINEECENAPA
jgi:hypothetical protein